MLPTRQHKNLSEQQAGSLIVAQRYANKLYYIRFAPAF